MENKTKNLKNNVKNQEKNPKNKENNQKNDKKIENNKNLENNSIEKEIEMQTNYNTGNEVTKREKKMSNAEKALPGLIITIVTLAIVLLAVSIAFFQVKKEKKQVDNSLSSIYASSYYTMVDSVNNMVVDSEKFQSLPTTEAQRMSLNNMSEDCEVVLAGLSILPISHNNVIAVTKFFNQVGGVCEAYLNKLNSGENLTNDELNLVSQISLILQDIKTSLNKQNEQVNKGNYNFIDSTTLDKNGMNEFSVSMGDLSNDSIDYPAMIFDGPFSSALEEKQILGLSESVVSKEDALNYLQNQVYNGTNAKIEFVRETSGEFETYDFNVTIDGVVYLAQVTKRDGFLLNINGHNEIGDIAISNDKAVDIALSFAKKVGLKNMNAVWLEVDNNCAYINLAYVQDDVIMYPDLIKVKVCLTKGNVLGWEARNYAFNHVTRNVSTNLNPADYEDKLGFDYKLQAINKCVIPLDDGKESLCFEYIVEKMDGLYYIYLDVNKQDIIKVLKVVNSNGVQLMV